MSLSSLASRAKPRIATTGDASTLADIGPEWTIIGRDYHDDDGRISWRYLGRDLGDADVWALYRARATGRIVTVTRREADGSRVLLGRAARPMVQAA